MFFQLVWQHSFQWIDFIGVADFLDNLSNFVVDVSWFDQSQSGLSSFVGSQDNISFFASHLCIFVWLNHDSMADESSETVDMDTELYFDEISLFDVCWIFREGAVISAYLVDGDGGGES